MNYIKEYYKQIKTGKINTSKKVRKQFELLVHDLDNPDIYHFDLARANKPIEFIERFCKHSKGKWINKPVKLELWQKAIIQAIFGFVDCNGYRRYKEVLVIVGRKNGKSTLLSAIGLYMLMGDKEGGAQVCCVASKKDQAKIVFSEASNMVKQSPVLSSHVRKRKSDLYVDLTFSVFEPLANDSNTLDGLNCHCGIIDELHSIKDRNIYDVVKQSMTTRTQPILFMITTAGFVRESIYDDMYEYATSVLDGTIKDDRLISFIYELDDRKEWLFEDCWVKANPSLGTVKDLGTLKEFVEKGKNDAKFLPTVLTKDFNIKENGYGSWLNFEDIDSKEVFELSNLSGTYGIGGVDLSSVGDLTCATMLIVKDSKMYCLQQYFIPSDIAERKEKEDGVPYKLWNERGLVTLCAGSKVNYSDVTQWYIDLRDTYGIYTLWVGYDRWGAQYWVDEMKANGFNMEEVIQGAKTMSTPMKLLASDLKEHKINYGSNPVLKWCLTNTQIEVDKNENIRPIKGKNQKQRIDGTVSLIDAYVIYNNHYDDYMNMI